jgi:hypothetical protein
MKGEDMADLINKNNISFRCSYGGECMAEIEDCKICVHYVCDYEDIQNVDVITEQEIRNQAITEFAERLNSKISDFVLEHKDNLEFASGISVAWSLIDEIAEQMKAGAV